MSATLTILTPCFWENASSCGMRAIEPSSAIISQMTPAGCSPASRARSTTASVCPARLSTPPSIYRSGNMWPGRARSSGSVRGSISALMVAARSCADMPVVAPFSTSTEIVNAVPKRAVLS